MPKRLLRVSEFAAELDVTVACVRRWILLRRITIVKVGRLVRIPVEELERTIRSGTRPYRHVSMAGRRVGADEGLSYVEEGDISRGAQA